MAVTGSPAGGRSYDPTCFAPLFAVEDRHFWFRARNRAIEAAVRHATSDLAPGYRVLEVGCGTGNVLRMLEHACERGLVTGMDVHAEGLGYARRRTRCPLLQGDAHAPPFRTRFHVVGLFDVLEHLDDDVRALRDAWNLLAPSGRLILTVPAHAWLWSYFDEVSHHQRRYAVAELAARLETAGFRVEYLTQYMASIVPLVWLRRWRPVCDDVGEARPTRRIHDLTTDEVRIVPGVNALLAWLLAQEARLIARRRHLPFGASLLAVAQKGL
jgi:SAM-dependent methyltransferase